MRSLSLTLSLSLSVSQNDRMISALSLVDGGEGRCATMEEVEERSGEYTQTAMVTTLCERPPFSAVSFWRSGSLNL